MRVLVVADIHANWQALQAINEPYDACLVLGDLVDYGPDPTECVDWAMANATYAVRGNHDHGVAQRIVPANEAGYRSLTAATRPLCWQMLSEAHRGYLARLPLSRHVRLDGKVLLLVHATPRDPLDEYLFNDEANWRKRIENVEADIVCVGHTHHQFQLQIDATTILNPGSVGQPRDGDPRAAYAIIENGKVLLRRVKYPIEETIERMNRLPVPEEVKQLSAAVWRTGGRASFLSKEEGSDVAKSAVSGSEE